MDNLEEMDRFLEKFNLLRLIQEENRNYEKSNYKHWNWNCDQTSPQKTKTQGQMASQVNSIKHLAMT